MSHLAQNLAITVVSTVAALLAIAFVFQRRALYRTSVKLAESLRRLDESQKLAELGSWELDLERNHLVWSDEVFRIFEIDRREFGASYEAFLNLVHPDDREAVNRAYSSSVDKRTPYEIVHKLRMPDGRIKTVRERAVTQYRDTNGRPVRSIGTVQDISREIALNANLNRQLDLLRESEERFAKSFQANPIPMGLRRIRDDVLLDVNQAFENLVQIPRDRLVGHSLAELNLYAKPETRAAILERLARGERISETEIAVRSASGEIRTTLMTVEILTLGGESCALASFVDLTDRLRSEQERKILESQLHEARKMEALGAFASGIVHDFNNMLEVIVGNVEIARQQLEVGAAIHGNLQLIDLAARRGADLVRRISSFAKGQRQPRRTIELREVLKNICSLLSSTLPDTIELTVELADDVPAIASDENQIHQIVSNLIVNAIQALPPTGGRITVSLKASLLHESIKGRTRDIPPGLYAVLSVADSGVGIDPAIQDRIFEPFFTTRPAGLGTGLGLAVVDGLVRAHNGHITLESQVGRGTTFKIWLPAVFGVLANTECARSPLATQEDGGSRAHCSALIDDDPAAATTPPRLCVTTV